MDDVWRTKVSWFYAGNTVKSVWVDFEELDNVYSQELSTTGNKSRNCSDNYLEQWINRTSKK